MCQVCVAVRSISAPVAVSERRTCTPVHLHSEVSLFVSHLLAQCKELAGSPVAWSVMGSPCHHDVAHLLSHLTSFTTQVCPLTCTGEGPTRPYSPGGTLAGHICSRWVEGGKVRLACSLQSKYPTEGLMAPGQHVPHVAHVRLIDTQGSRLVITVLDLCFSSTRTDHLSAWSCGPVCLLCSRDKVRLTMEMERAQESIEKRKVRGWAAILLQVDNLPQDFLCNKGHLQRSVCPA
jgi:hypothetical protein